MIRASSILFWFGLTIAASLAFYRTNGGVQSLEEQLRNLNASIEAEQQSLHVLKAEWVYLANPARVEKETRRHLALRPTAPQQIARLDDLTEILPTRGEAMSSVAVNATPIATVRTSLTARTAPRRAVAAKPAKPAAAMAVAAADTNHINERMVIQPAAAAAPTEHDPIGTLIDKLDAPP
ncbi:MAG: hypothetical protein SFW62_06700 [Alphaproteobacteria bacterium]|nr:hypothetical protein [Alphaproteobacteria bacterium]